jgi:hypothetical protein
LKKPAFSKRDLLQWTVPAKLGSSDQLKVLASLSLFLKSEKIPDLLYVGRGPQYRPFHDFRPVPSAYRPQISNHGRDCTQALLLYIMPVSRGVTCLEKLTRILCLVNVLSNYTKNKTGLSGRYCFGDPSLL